MEKDTRNGITNIHVSNKNLIKKITPIGIILWGYFILIFFMLVFIPQHMALVRLDL
jgi:hypothetical protein